MRTRYQLAFAVLLLPALLNLFLVLAARRKFPAPEEFETKEGPHTPLNHLFRWYVLGGALLAIGFADWALVAFHAARLELWSPAWLPVLYAGVMAVDGLAALIFGAWFDKHGLVVLAVSTVVSALFAPLVFLAPSALVLTLGAGCWAVGMGAQEATKKNPGFRLNDLWYQPYWDPNLQRTVYP